MFFKLFRRLCVNQLIFVVLASLLFINEAYEQTITSLNYNLDDQSIIVFNVSDEITSAADYAGFSVTIDGSVTLILMYPGPSII